MPGIPVHIMIGNSAAGGKVLKIHIASNWFMGGRIIRSSFWGVGELLGGKIIIELLFIFVEAVFVALRSEELGITR